MKDSFLQELKESGYLHFPLPLHRERSLEAERQKKEVLKARWLWCGKEGEEKETYFTPVHSGIGKMELTGQTIRPLRFRRKTGRSITGCPFG